MVMDEYDLAHDGSWQYKIEISLHSTDDDISKLINGKFAERTQKYIIEEICNLRNVLNILDARTVTCIGARVMNLTHRGNHAQWILVQLFRSLDNPTCTRIN